MRHMPLTVLDIAGMPEPYRHKLLLSRPDQVVAWRGDQLPDDALGLIDRVRGALRFVA